MNRLEKNINFLREAYKVARKFSTDKYVQNGAILVRDNTIISSGANKFPDEVKETEERWKYPLKPFYVSHAERNAIFNAAKKGIPTEGATMYCPWFACHECADAIINSGIMEVVGHAAPDIWFEAHRKYDDDGKPKKSIWDDSIFHGLIKLREAGVKLKWIVEEIGGVSIIFMGEEMTP